ncbi:MAG: haloacid dehalogenase family protein [uncultured archaeon A07HR60]|nr:MAG: haloacid dehalogenase family protein [uncultured archaeon A07HR60]
MVVGEYDFWVFDLDGTLVDAEWEYTRTVFDEMGSRLGRSFTDREARTLWYGLGGQRNDTLRSWGIDPTRFWKEFHDIEDPQVRAEASVLHEDARRLLRAVTAPCGIVTHCQQFLCDPVLEQLDLQDRFSTVVCCTDELGWKPDPTPVAHAIEQMNVSGSGVLVGDSPGDIGAAWNAGLDAIHIERLGTELRGRCVRGDHRVDRLDRLLVDETTASD